MGTTDKKYLDLQGLAYLLEKIDLKYAHPTTGATDPGILKVGRDSLGHVTFGTAITPADIGAVPTTRKINNKPLSADVTLGVSDIGGAVPNTRTIAGIDLKDNITKDELRSQLGITGAMHFAGTTLTGLTDGATTNPIKIKQSSTDTTGQNYTAIAGDVVLYSGKEFIWTGSAWEVLGDEGSYALKTRKITAGTGLTGGGDLTADVTVSHASSTAQDPGILKVGRDALGHVTFGNAISASASSNGGHSHTVTSSIDAEKVVTSVSPSTTKLSISTGTKTVLTGYTGSTSKLVTTSVTGVSSSTTTASKATAGTAVVYGQADVGTKATVATISDKTSTIGNANVGASITITGVSGNTSASTVSGGTTKDIAKVGTAVVYGTADCDTAVSGIAKVGSQITYGNANVGTAQTVATGVKSATATATTTAYTASYDNDCLVLAPATVTVTPTVTLNTTSVTPAATSSKTAYVCADGTGVSITPAKAAPTTQKISPAVSNGQITGSYTIGSVTVPVAASATTFNPATTSSNTIDTFLGETEVTSAKAADTTRKITPYTFADVTVPIKAASATTVATGSVSTTASGAGVLIGLGDASTVDVLNSASLASGTTGTEVVTGVTTTKGAVSNIAGTTNTVDNHTHTITIK